MNRYLRSLTIMAITAASMVTIAACSKTKPYSPPPPERLSVSLDPGRWVVGFRDLNAPGEMVQYVHPGQSIENWTEMFTERTFPGLQNTSNAGQSFASYQKTTNERCPKTKWTMIEKSSEDVVYEAEIAGCSDAEPPHEIGRLLSGDRALYQLIWQTKAETIDQETKNRWVDTMGQSAVVPY